MSAPGQRIATQEPTTTGYVPTTTAAGGGQTTTTVAAGGGSAAEPPCTEQALGAAIGSPVSAFERFSCADGYAGAVATIDGPAGEFEGPYQFKVVAGHWSSYDGCNDPDYPRSLYNEVCTSG